MFLKVKRAVIFASSAVIFVPETFPEVDILVVKLPKSVNFMYPLNPVIGKYVTAALVYVK